MTALIVTEDVHHRIADELRLAAPGHRHVVIRGDGIDGEVTDARVLFLAETAPELVRHYGEALAAPSLAWVHLGSVGTEHPVVQGLLARGVRVTNTRGANADLIGQTAILHVLAHSRRLDKWKEAQRRHAWERHDVEDLADKVLAVLGLGDIGTVVARLGGALGMRVIGWRRAPRGDEACEVWGVDRLDDLLELADYVVVALPGGADTHRLLSADRLARLKATAFVVNVGRGSVIDEAALTDALVAGRLGGAALDVFEVEPLPPTSPLWDLPNVTITPHASGRSPKKAARATALFLENLRRFTQGEELLDEVRQ